MTPRTLSQAWKYVHPPSRFGRYPLLVPEWAMTAYPDPRPVPDNIARPPYVPGNFFTDGWGDHLPGSDRKFEEKLGREGEEGVRRAGKVVSDLLKEVKRIIKVGLCQTYRRRAFRANHTVARDDYERHRCSCS